MKLILAAIVVLGSGLSCSPGPLGSCPSGSPMTQCLARVDAWKAVGSDSGVDADGDGGPGEAGCPSTEALGPDGVRQLGLSGYRFEGEATYEPSTDRCCYTTVGSGC